MLDKENDVCSTVSVTKPRQLIASSILGTTVALLFSIAPTAVVHAQDGADVGLEEVIVTGSRRQGRSPTDVSSPVDIIGAEQLQNQGDIDTINLIRATVPSFNSDANPLSGTPTYMRPVSLRGLSPDHVLVLMNGKRRHRGANIATFSGGNTDGAQGPDISAIPAIALKQIQVLRDGAAAQYGSDAIAGVINFILDDSAEGGRVEAKYADTYDGDGTRYLVGGTYGMPLGNSGFVRLSAEFSEQDESIRSIQRPDALALQNGSHPLIPGNSIKVPVTNYGVPEINDELKLAINVGAEINANSEFYAFGTLAKRSVEGDFFYRNPTGRFGVFTDDDDGGNFLVGDMAPDDGLTCDGGIDFGGTGVVNNPIGVNDADVVTRMQAVFADPNCFSFLEFFPGGYTPRFGADVEDLYGSAGIRGELSSGLTYDFSATAGSSRIGFFASNVPNPSMGSLSPTAFPRVGDRIMAEKFVNADFAYPVTIEGFDSPLNVAFGLAWQDEDFEILTGEQASFQAGVLANQGFLIGEEAIPGFSPLISGDFGRHNVAAYIDLEADITSALTLGAAVRTEDFSDDTGSETTYKVSGMFRFTDDLAFRSTYSTGFHAPTIGQSRFSTTTTEFDANGNLLESGQIPPTSPTALAVGAQPLRPETSDSITAGIVYETDRITLTLDTYYIEVDDRVTLSASQSLTDQQRQELIDQGFQAAAGIGSFRFFTNDFATETKGVDLIATMPLDLFSGGETELALAFNYTKTEVTSFDPTDPNELLDTVRITQIEENYPETRGNVTLRHTRDRWRSHVRVNHYGSFTEMHVNGNLPINASSTLTVDAEFAFNVTDELEVAVGADNLLGEEPDKNPWDFIVGSKFPTTQPNGLDNGLWYLRARYSFE